VTRTVKLTGANSLRRVLRQAPADMRAEITGPVDASAAALLAGMLVKVPRDTGDLASVVKSKKARDGMSAHVGAGVGGKRDQKKAGYRAHFVEFGTVHQAAQPFVYPTAREQWPDVRRRIADGVAAALLKIAGKG
jgi:HK97 gp10 family phage protein